MKIKELKLYYKYKNINIPNTEYIFIGIDNKNYYWFIYKNEIFDTPFSFLNNYDFDSEQIVNALNLETSFDEDGEKCIKGYEWEIYSEENVETNFKPILKDKLNNIINR